MTFYFVSLELTYFGHCGVRCGCDVSFAYSQVVFQSVRALNCSRAQIALGHISSWSGIVDFGETWNIWRCYGCSDHYQNSGYLARSLRWPFWLDHSWITTNCLLKCLKRIAADKCKQTTSANWWCVSLLAHSGELCDFVENKNRNFCFDRIKQIKIQASKISV